MGGHSNNQEAIEDQKFEEIKRLSFNNQKISTKKKTSEKKMMPYVKLGLE